MAFSKLLGGACLAWLAALAIVVLAGPTFAVEEQKSTCDGPKQAIHLAGFLPDGYFVRAKERLNTTLSHVFEATIHQLKGRREFVSFRESKVGKSHPWIESSTVLWVEEPLLVLGDSDSLEQYIARCHKQDSKQTAECADIRKIFKTLESETDTPKLQRTVSTKDNRPLDDEGNPIDPWEHEAQQGVKCLARTGPNDEELKSFHIILLRDWSYIGFESFSDRLRNGQVKNITMTKSTNTSYQGDFALATTPESKPDARRVFQRGSISTSGSKLLLWTRFTHPKHQVPSFATENGDQPFEAFGFVPEGDLKRQIDSWPAEVEIVECQFLYGGLRRVQTILAMDNLREEQTES